MHRPASTQTAAASDQVVDGSTIVQMVSRIELLDACGNGHTAEDLARFLAARAHALRSAGVYALLFGGPMVNSPADTGAYLHQIVFMQ
jgi:hypothetical protein